MEEDERIISLFKELGLSKALAKSLILLSINIEEIEKKKEKKLKSLFDLVYDEEECEEYYNEAYYDVIAFPPNSSPPSPDKKSMTPEYLIHDRSFDHYHVSH